MQKLKQYEEIAKKIYDNQELLDLTKQLSEQLYEKKKMGYNKRMLITIERCCYGCMFYVILKVKYKVVITQNEIIYAFGIPYNKIISFRDSAIELYEKYILNTDK